MVARLCVGVQVDLVNLLDLRMLQDEGKGEEDEEMEERCEEKGQREQMSSGDLRGTTICHRLMFLFTELTLHFL